MTKNTLIDEKQNHDERNLTRRSIHLKTKHSEYVDEKKDEFNNRPILYPTLQCDDEVDGSDEEKCDEDELDHRDGQGKSLLESFNETFKGDYGKYLLCFVFMFLLFVLPYYYYSSTSSSSLIGLPLNEKLKLLQKHFPDQNHLTFRILENSLKKVVSATKEPSAPAIFTVSVNKNAVYRAHEFSRYLVNFIAPESSVMINESVSWRNKPNEIKLKIDNEIQSTAESKDLFIVIVDNLQNIPLKSAMIFHSYCDHESAPFKQAVFLFIVPLDEILPKDATSKKIDNAAAHQLKNIWNTASSDEIDSLITRITVNVINIS